MITTRVVSDRVLSLILPATAFLLILPPIIEAQSRRKRATPPTVRGSVFDWKKNGVAKAKITIENSKLKKETDSDQSGHFVFTVPSGVYRLTVVATGFKRHIVESLLVKRHSLNRVNIQLELGVPNDRDLVPSPTPPN
jgi:carboxypeptidase family protein